MLNLQPTTSNEELSAASALIELRNSAAPPRAGFNCVVIDPGQETEYNSATQLSSCTCPVDMEQGSLVVQDYKPFGFCQINNELSSTHQTVLTMSVECRSDRSLADEASPLANLHSLWIRADRSCCETAIKRLYSKTLSFVLFLH